MYVLEIKNLSKTYSGEGQSFTALRHVNMSLEPGSFVALIGQSGSGKSTLMNIIGLLDSQSGGEITLGGSNIAALDEKEKAHIRKNTIGFIFQSFYLLSHLTALENVTLPMIFCGVDKTDREARAKELLELVGMGNRLHHMPNMLSGGQKQRVAIARALANRPGMILADEPCGNLDVKTGEEVMRLLRSLADMGMLVLMVTHNTKHLDYVDKSYTIEDGILSGPG